MSWQSLTTRRGRKPRYAGGPSRKRAVAKATTVKDEQQDKRIKVLSRRIGKPEIKWTDTVVGSSNLAVAGAIIGLNYMPQGDQPFNRAGNQVKSKKLNIDGYIVYSSTEATDRVVRMLLVWDKSTSGAYPTITGNTNTGTVAILNNITTTGTVPAILAPVSVETRDRFTVVMDKLIHLRIAASGIQLEMPFKIRKKLSKITRFVNTTSAVTSLMTNGLYFIYMVDNVGAAPPQIGFCARYFFEDD